MSGENFAGGQYPPLNICLLIDSRMGSRMELRASLSSMHLFERVVEPESLAAGYKTLLSEQIDTCIFGPSLRADKIHEFLEDIKAADCRTDCAFLMACCPGEQVEGVHGNFEFPCSRQNLNQAIVKAIQVANGGEFPSPKKLHPITGQPLNLKDYILDRTEIGQDLAARDQVSASNQPDQPHHLESAVPSTAPSAPEVSAGVLSNQVSALGRMLAELEPAHLKFSATGDPTATTVSIVRGMVEQLFPTEALQKSSEHSGQLSQFKSYLESLIYEWIQNATIGGKKTASAKLRESILQYFQY